jgi:uncharacterized protein YeeX (DUF496 family)
MDEKQIKAHLERLCEDQKVKCSESIIKAINDYHHPGMSTEEIVTIIRNVNNNRTQAPDLTDTVRALII